MNYYSSDGTTALHLAAQLGNPDIFIKLISSTQISDDTINRLTSDPLYPTILLSLSRKDDKWNNAIDLLLPRLKSGNVRNLLFIN